MTMYRASIVLLFSVTAMLLPSCSKVGGPLGIGGGDKSSGGELSGKCTGDFGASVAAAHFEAFMTATADFTTAAAALEGDLVAACQDMGRELGVSEEAMAGKPGDSLAKAACEPMRAALEAELGSLKASAKVNLNVQATPPVCRAEMDAYAECVGGCEVDVDPGKLELECEGGELRGECSATCTGTCAVEVSGECSGSCEGTCTGGCSGTCHGACDGECSATGPDGSCQGSCNGSCNGSCSASCEGSCQGQCAVEASGRCEGECRGGCSVDFKAPTCTGDVRAPSASAECSAACDAQIDAKVECQPGHIEADFSGELDTNIGERVARVRAAIEGGMPRILAAQAKLGQLAASGNAMAKAGGGIPTAAAEFGIGAVACATQAVAMVPKAVASISASVEVSVSVSATATLNAG